MQEKIKELKILQKVYTFTFIVLSLIYSVWGLFNNSVFDEFGEPIMSFGWQCVFLLGQCGVLVSAIFSVVCTIGILLIKKDRKIVS